ncbi:MAG: TVP38/TMEM64 family protein [Planctomycetaceae bacterium]|nr:TVP38/TMEM64 family protein [Planctomycetaceae bacterium]
MTRQQSIGLAASGLLMIFVWGWCSGVSLSSLAVYEAEILSFRTNHPGLASAAAAGIYIVITAFSLPFATAATLVTAWIFGFPVGLLIVSFSSTAGATLAFLLSRHLLRDSVEKRFPVQASRIRRAIERDGAAYLLTLRLVPAIPFFIVNLVMGLTRMPTITFWWVSQLGMLPGTIVYVYAGSVVPRMETLLEKGVSGALEGRQLIQLTTALSALALMPWLIKAAVRRFRPQESGDR